MKLATLRLTGGTVAARVDPTRVDPSAATDSTDTQPADRGTATVIDGYADVGALLRAENWQDLAANAAGPVIDLADADYAPVVPTPGKIFCVGLNYATHIAEMGREMPTHPTLFVKVADALAGPYDDVVVPDYAAAQLDWEAELAFVIGRTAYRVPAGDAAAHIAGYSVINDYTMRDYQYRSPQWDQGKNFDKTSGFGPWLDTDYQLGTPIETRLNGEVMQSATTDDLVFGPAELVDYISHIVTLNPGDVVITGTTGGVGHARTPARYIADGDTVEIRIGGLGAVRNTTVVK
ncbi:fumarylacetoacetate hydrolase family protein [Gordonia sinesedis]